MVRTLTALALSLSAAASDGMTFDVDQPDRWYDPTASHHGQHALGGMVIGAAAYAGAGLVTDSRPWRYGTAIAAGAVIGYGYELATGRDGSSYVDPVDAGYVVVGALVGAVAADLTGQAIAVLATPDVVAVSIAWRFD